MLVKQSHKDVTTADGSVMRVFIIEPNVPGYPNAKWPGCVVFSEIYQVTGPVQRFGQAIASAGFVVAMPSSYHGFVGPEALAYDGPGTDLGNKLKITKTVESYDEDATLTIDLLTSMASCNGRIASTGMCLGGHLALRAAFDSRVLATFCWFGTDVHSATLGAGQKDDTLERVAKGELTNKGEVAMVFGLQDNHVPREGRDKIRAAMNDAGVEFSFYEVPAQHAFVRDESSKGRFDGKLTQSLSGLMMEMFERRVVADLGPRGQAPAIEHVC